MRVLFCGDRNWSDYSCIRQELEKLPKGSIIIEGCAAGADSIAGWLAEQMGFEVMKFPADWKKYKRAAGPIRNQQMLDEGKPDMVFAFHENIEISKGTKDMVTRAEKAGLEVRIFTGIKKS